RDEAVCEEIVSFPVSAVEVVACRSEWNENDAILFIDCEFAPVVDAAGACSDGFLRPGVGAELVGLGNAVEGPLQFAGKDVIGAHVSRCGIEICSARRKRHDDGVLVDPAGIATGPAYSTVRLRAGIDAAVISECRDRL